MHFQAAARPIATVSSPDDLNEATLYLNEKGGDRVIELPSYAQFRIKPNPDSTTREVLCIAGASGGGKSWIARGYAADYHATYPKRPVFVFSALTKDATLDTLTFLKRLDIKSFVDEPVEDGEELKGFKKSLVIFDDCEALDGAEKKAVDAILKSLLTLGRHSVTSVIVCNHLPTRGKDTRLLLNESTLFVVFPQAMGYHTLQYLCEQHVGLSKKEISELRHVRSRWVALSKSFPRYMIASNEAHIL